MVRIYRKINYTSTVLFLILDYQFIIKKNFINLSLLFMYPFLESFTKQQIIISRLSNNIYIYIYIGYARTARWLMNFPMNFTKDVLDASFLFFSILNRWQSRSWTVKLSIIIISRRKFVVTLLSLLIVFIGCFIENLGKIVSRSFPFPEWNVTQVNSKIMHANRTELNWTAADLVKVYPVCLN